MDKMVWLIGMVLFSLLFPIGLMVIWKRRTHVRIWPFAAGALMWLLFAMVLEQILHMICLVNENPVSNAIKNSWILYSLYASFAAGLFEETGRLVAFRFLLKKQPEKDTAVAYGIGHGGMEVILIIGTTYLIYLLAVMGVHFGSEEADAQLLRSIETFTGSGVLIAAFERVSAVMLHIGLSIMVYRSVREQGRKWLFPIAILLHAMADMPAAIYQSGMLGIWSVEVWTFMLGLGTLVYGLRKLYGKSKIVQ